MNYQFIEDPGHGWLAVPVRELRELGIVDKISGYSYLSHDNQVAYLEEDCDLTRFFDAKKISSNATFESLGIRVVHANGDAFVRSLPRFVAARVAA